MWDALARLVGQAGDSSAGSENAEESEGALRRVTAALLYEIVRADGEVAEAELAVMRAAIQSLFEIPHDELERLIAEAETASHQAVSLYELTQRVDRSLGPEQKKRVVELLWLVAFADGEKHALEEHLVRRIAELLHVDHPDFIDAKLRARNRSQGGGATEPGAR